MMKEKILGLFFKILFVLGLGFFSSCASSEKKVCPTEAEEPVSSCRAEENCRDQSTATRAGVGVGFGFGNMGVGIMGSRPIGNYSRCYNEDMDAQKKRAGVSTEEKKSSDGK